MRGVEPHVERDAARETALDAEAAGRIGQLIGRKAQVEQHAVDAADSEGVEDLGQLCITGLSQGHARVGKNAGGPRQHRRIAIQSDQFSVGSELFEDELAMTAAADRAVDHDQSRAEVQELQNFPDKDRTMNGRSRITAGRRQIGHCFENVFWVRKANASKCATGGSRASAKPVAFAPKDSGPKSSGERCGRDRQLKALLSDFQIPENPKTTRGILGRPLASRFGLVGPEH